MRALTRHGVRLAFILVSPWLECTINPQIAHLRQRFPAKDSKRTIIVVSTDMIIANDGRILAWILVQFMTFQEKKKKKTDLKVLSSLTV